MLHAERVDRGDGRFPDRRNIEALDQLMGPLGEQAEDAKSPKPGEAGKPDSQQSRDQKDDE